MNTKRTSSSEINYNIQPNLVNSTNVVDDTVHLSAEVFINMLRMLRDKEIFPSRVIIYGDLEINITDIELILPKICTIQGNFFIHTNQKIEFPDTLTVNGNLTILECTELKKLTTKMVVTGNLYIVSNPNIEQIAQELTVTKDMQIFACAKLQELSGSFNVGGTLNLRFNALKVIDGDFTVNDEIRVTDLDSLTTIKGKWNILKKIYITGCPELQTIEGRFGYNVNNFTNIENNLEVTISHCDKLTSISASMVAKQVNIIFCAELNRITGILDVKAKLLIMYCPALTDISATDNQNTIVEELHLRACNSLTALSPSIRVISRLNINNCNRLVDLPNIIFSLSNPQSLQVLFYRIDFARLSTNLVNQNIESISHRDAFDIVINSLTECHSASQLNIVDSSVLGYIRTQSLIELTDYWNSNLEPQQQLPSLLLNQNETELLKIFLNKVLSTNTTFSDISTKYLAQRIFQLFTVINQKPDIKPLIFNIIEEGLASCSDRIIQTLTIIELKYIVNDIIEKAKTEGKDQEQELLLLGKRFFYLDQLTNYVTNYLNDKKDVDEIEVMLAFEIALAEKLNLPISVRYMCFSNEHNVTSKDITNAYNYVLTQDTEEKTTEFLKTWEPLLVYTRPKNIINYADLPFLKVEKTDCIFSLSKTKEMVYLNNRCYDYKKFCQWYIQYGNADPITRMIFDWKDVYKIN